MKHVFLLPAPSTVKPYIYITMFSADLSCSILASSKFTYGMNTWLILHDFGSTFHLYGNMMICLRWTFSNLFYWANIFTHSIRHESFYLIQSLQNFSLWVIEVQEYTSLFSYDNNAIIIYKTRPKYYLLVMPVLLSLHHQTPEFSIYDPIVWRMLEITSLVKQKLLWNGEVEQEAFDIFCLAQFSILYFWTLKIWIVEVLRWYSTFKMASDSWLELATLYYSNPLVDKCWAHFYKKMTVPFCQLKY